MENNYIAPQIEVIELEVEDVLCQSNQNVDDAYRNPSIGRF